MAKVKKKKKEKEKRQTIPRVSENMEKLEPSYIAGKNIKWCSHFGKQFGSF